VSKFYNKNKLNNFKKGWKKERKRDQERLKRKKLKEVNRRGESEKKETDIKKDRHRVSKEREEKKEN
jgi:hypothetical protein